jgi:dihydroflavonol-4-reductase
MVSLVTGATGFVGTALVRRLLAEGAAVRVLARPRANRRLLEGLPVEIAVGDLTDPRTLDRAVEGCEAVFHLAADYRLWARDPQAIYRTNLDGTRALMVAAGAAGVRRIVYTSSVATLGTRRDGSDADETTPVDLADMVGHYKRSKYLAEEAVRALAADGLPVVIVNPSAPIGPRDIRPTPTGRIIVDAARGRIPVFVETGLNVVHVDDVATGHLLAYQRGRVGERYILGSENLSLATILETVTDLVGLPAPRIRIPWMAAMGVACFSELAARLGVVREPIATRDAVRMSRKLMFFSSDRARRELGYSARPAADAIRDAVDWFRSNGYLGAV